MAGLVLLACVVNSVHALQVSTLAPRLAAKAPPLSMCAAAAPLSEDVVEAALEKFRDLKFQAKEARARAETIAQNSPLGGLKKRLEKQEEWLAEARAAQDHADELEVAMEAARVDAERIMEEYVAVVPEEEAPASSAALAFDEPRLNGGGSEEERVKEFNDLVGITVPTVAAVGLCLGLAAMVAASPH